MSEQKYPPGWDQGCVRQVIEHYENQTEDEQFAEIEAARESDGVTMIAVPTELAQLRQLAVWERESCHI